MDDVGMPGARSARTESEAADDMLAVSLQSLHRIEAALARLENAVPACVAQSADLRRRHDDLKTSVARSLGNIDKLISSHGKLGED